MAVVEERITGVARSWSFPRLALILALPQLTRQLRANSLVRNSAYIMATTLITSALGYGYWVIAARSYATYDVGLASALIAAMQLTSSVANLGVGSYLIQALPGRAAGRDWSRLLNAALVTGTSVSVFVGLVVAILLPHLSPQFATPDGDALLFAAFISGVALTTLTALLDQVFVAERAAGNMLVRNVLFAGLKIPLLLLPFLLLHMGALGILCSWIIASGVALVVGLCILVPRLRRQYRPSLREVVSEIRSMRASLIWHHFINLGGAAPMYVLPMLVTIRLTATDNAYFYTTWMLGSLFFMVSSSVASSLFAEGSHASEHLPQKVRSSVVFIGAMLAPAVLAFFVFGGTFLSLFGAQYALNGLPLLRILIVSAVPDAVTNIAVSVLRVRRRLRLAAGLNISMAAAALATSWYLLPRFGIVAAGYGWIIGQLSGCLLLAGMFGALRLAPVAQRLAERLTLRNMRGFARYVALRIRFRNLPAGVFFIDKGSDIELGRAAQVRVGHGLRIMRDFTAHFQGRVTIGRNVFFNRGCYVSALSELTIGDNCLFGERVSIHDENHVIAMGAGPRFQQGFVASPIVIGDNVWVGAKATILAGVHIGANSVIGANAVVTRDIPANAVAVGIPAKVVRILNQPELAETLGDLADTLVMRAARRN